MTLENLFGELSLEATQLQILGTLAQAGGLPVDVGANLNVTAEFGSDISTLNSTQVPLAADATFTGVWEDVVNYAAIAVTYFTDQYSAVNGAKIQWSTDGVNVDIEESGTVPPNLGGYAVVPPKARYMRVVYTNGAVAQTILRSQVILLFNSQQIPISAMASPTHDLTYVHTTKAAVHAKRASTQLYEPLNLEDGGALKVWEQRESGIWAYGAGVSGTESVPADAKVLSIAAHSLTGGSMVIDGGDPIPIPANVGWVLEPRGNLVGAFDIEFTGTDTYFVEYVT